MLKSRRPKLHPIFSKCRWHRTEEFLQYLDGDEDTGVDPFPIDEVDDCKNSLLHIAVQNGHDDFVQALIDRGIDVDLQNMTGQTAMHFAKFYDHRRIFFMLRRAGANDRIINREGKTCYEMAENTST
jgi:ankyrin repeat protein